MVVSAGLLLYRVADGNCKVLLVHPGGPFFRHKDNGAWSLPKGLVEDGEDIFTAAKRECEEELGIALPPGMQYIDLGSVRQKSGKRVHAWAAERAPDISQIRSNTFRMEYPPRSGKWIDFPEIDRAEWYAIPVAREKILTAQLPFLDRLEEILKL